MSGGHTEPNPLEIGAASLHAIEVLKLRPGRGRGPLSEVMAYERLHETLLRAPGRLHQDLAEAAVALFGVESAGISLLESRSAAGDVFNSPFLVHHPPADFPILQGVQPPVEEALVVPFYVDDKPVGTLWLVLHRAGEQFDYEDAQQLVRLSRFAAMGYQMVRDARHAAQRDAHQVFLLNLDDTLRSLSDSNAIEYEACCALGRHLGVNRVTYAEDLTDRERLTLTRNYVDGAHRIEGQLRCNDYGNSSLLTLRTGERVVRADVRRDQTLPEAERHALELLEIGASVEIPLVRRGTLVAILAAHSNRARDWTSDEITIIESVASRTWEAIERTRAEEALRRADRQKDEFLAMLAHELRNPLGSLSNAAEILRKVAEGTPDATRPLQILGRQTRQITRLVDDLLDLSRIATGRITLESHPVALETVIDQVVDGVQPALREKGHQLIVSIDEPPIYVRGDRARLVQALSNVMHNAVKYTDAGGQIAVLVSEHDGLATIEVRDDGVGISAELLPHVFDLFVQSPRTLDRSQGGLGIGLSVVRRLIEMQGGSVGVASDGAGRGSCFTIHLPRIEAPETLPAQASAADSGARKRILVVDDNADAADSLAMLLGFERHEVHTVYGGIEALEAAQQRPFDVIILDIGLPRLDGYEVARRIRARKHDSVLVAVTGYGQPEDLEQARAAGFDAHLMKPVVLEELQRVLNRAVDGSGFGVRSR